MNKIIYALRSVSLNKIKIGEANIHSLFNRVKSHQTGSADELELIGVHFGNFTSDKNIHPLLRSSHSHLEWFENTEEVRLFIKQHFLVFPKALSLLNDISWSMSETISPETIAIDRYVKGKIKNYELESWLKEFNMLQYLKDSFSN